jgi:folate-dependent tRNA-U54 methylase TrmFO/GidA
MNINYGLIPSIESIKYKSKKEKKVVTRKNIAIRAIKDIKLWQIS